MMMESGCPCTIISTRAGPWSRSHPGLQQQQKQPACAWAHRPASHEDHGADRKKLPRSYITLSIVLRPCRHARLSVPLGCGSLCSLGCFLAWGRTNGDGCRRDRFRGCRDRGHSLTPASRISTRSEERRNEHFVATTVLPFAWEIHRSPGPGQTLKTARLFLFSAGASYTRRAATFLHWPSSKWQVSISWGSDKSALSYHR
jgi:hypothetical protein